MIDHENDPKLGQDSFQGKRTPPLSAQLTETFAAIPSSSCW